ncbi:MAG: hypothetical protein VW683_00365 [Betaproteobacteria bacterium]|jgi:hypothetical protein
MAFSFNEFFGNEIGDEFDFDSFGGFTNSFSGHTDAPHSDSPHSDSGHSDSFGDSGGFADDGFDIFRDTTFGPFTDHSDGGFGEFQHQDSPFSDHGDHSDSPPFTDHGDTPFGDHSDSPPPHSDHSDTPFSDSQPHTDQPTSHTDIPHSDETSPHSDIVAHTDIIFGDNTGESQPPGPPPGPSELNLRFEPDTEAGGFEVFNAEYRSGDQGPRIKSYSIQNLDNEVVSVRFEQIPDGIDIFPNPVTIDVGEAETIVVTLTNPFLRSLSLGQTTKTIPVRFSSTVLSSQAHSDVPLVEHADHTDQPGGSHNDHSDINHTDSTHTDHSDSFEVIPNHGDHADGEHGDSLHQDHSDHSDHADHSDINHGDGHADSGFFESFADTGFSGFSDTGFSGFANGGGFANSGQEFFDLGSFFSDDTELF